MASTSSEPSRVSAGPSFLSLALSGEAGLLLLAWGLSVWLQVSPLSLLRPTGASVLWGVAGTLPLLLALAWLLASSWAVVRRLVDLVTESLSPVLAPQSLPGLAGLALLAGVSEEILFRGVIQTALARSISPAIALLLTSLLFGLVHFASRAYALLAAIMGLYLGALFLLADNLIAPILAHAGYDFAALLWLSRIRPRYPPVG
jgi:CAAX protease family protein